MEILIPGLILVALMVYASTRIKKRAAEAFEPEFIETERFSLKKPDGFLHVMRSSDHDFEAYSQEFGEADFRVRRGRIEVDLLRDVDLRSACESLRTAAERYEVISEARDACRIKTEESANEIPATAFYKFVEARDGVYRLRFAALSKHVDDYLRRIEETLDSFTVSTQ